MKLTRNKTNNNLKEYLKKDRDKLQAEAEA
jgi:hypothetical protein